MKNVQKFRKLKESKNFQKCKKRPKIRKAELLKLKNKNLFTNEKK